MSPLLRSRRLRWTTLYILCCFCVASLSSNPALAAKGEGAPGQAFPRVRMPGPDLVINSISLSQEGHVQYEIQNVGDKSAGEFLVDVYLEKWKSKHSTIKYPRGLIFGVPSKRRTGVKVDCKGAWVRVVVDSQNTVRESDEQNNQRRLHVRLPCPDLTVAKYESGTWRICKWTTLRGGLFTTRARVLVRIINRGDAYSPPFKIVLLAGTPRGKFIKTEIMIRNLQPGKSKLLQTRHTFPSGFGLKARVIVDVDNQVAESNEKNNEVRVDRIPVGGGPKVC